MSGMLMSERFVAVFPSLVRELGSLESAVVLQHLNFEANDDGLVTMTYEEISDATGIGVRTVERRIKHLRDGGWLVAYRTARFDSTKTYQIVHDSLPSSNHANADPEPANLAGSESANLAGSSVLKEGKNPPTPQRGASEIEPAFAAFYAAYPKPTGKAATRAVWTRLIREGVEPIAIMTALGAQKAHYSDRETKYWKDPERWLKHRLWEDDLSRLSPTEPRSMYDVMDEIDRMNGTLS